MAPVWCKSQKSLATQNKKGSVKTRNQREITNSKIGKRPKRSKTPRPIVLPAYPIEALRIMLQSASPTLSQPPTCTPPHSHTHAMYAQQTHTADTRSHTLSHTKHAKRSHTLSHTKHAKDKNPNKRLQTVCIHTQ
jgi:hypothetical protein